jgi:putative tricarboxylic transport membrane protein
MTTEGGARPRGPQLAIGAGVLALALLLAAGALSIPSEAGYAGVGPNFLPWLVAAALGLCGTLMLVHAWRGGWRRLEPPSGAARPDVPPVVWVAAGIVANATLITTIGFILACTLCFMLAVRGLRSSEGRPGGGLRQTVLDFVTGFLIAGPAFWLFTKVLGINLPGLSGTGWI